MTHVLHPAVGLDLLPIRRTYEISDLVAYAGATWDWHRLHYDAERVRALGLPAPVVDGQMFGALLVEQVQDALVAVPGVVRVFVEEVSFRFAAMVFAGDTVTVHGTITSVEEVAEGMRIVVDQEIHATGDDGDRIAIRGAACTVLLTTEDAS